VREYCYRSFVPHPKLTHDHAVEEAGRETLLEPSGSGGTPDPFAQIRQQGAALHGAIERLTPLRRRLLVLAVSHGSSHEEIAAEAAFAVGTVKSHPRGALATIPAGISGVNRRRAPIGV
jgi:DNA-directed RNA polymerase specialized sigma24 family protein